MTTLTWTTELVTTECWCGVPHAIPSSLMRMANEDGKTVYCPLGHTWVVTKTEVQKLKEKLAREEEIAARRLARIDQEVAERQAVERRLSAARGQATKLRKRAANGVCPCCHRSFVQLSRHMATKHPDYAADEREPTA